MAYPPQPVREITNSDLLLELADMRRDINEIKRDGKETKEQAKLTNGRVSSLEDEKRIAEAVRKERAEHLANEARQKADDLATVTKRHEIRMTFWQGAALVLLGSAATQLVPPLLSALGIA